MIRRSDIHWFVALVFLLWVEGIFARSREEPIISYKGGGQPYMVVYSDPGGSSELPPGLYVRSQQKENGQWQWEMALEGEILLRPVSGGLSLQLDMGNKTGRYESVGILNGRPTIFSVFSRQGTPQSFVVLGDGEAQVIDPMTGRSVSLPLIKNIADVSLSSVVSETENLQVILVSLKAPSPLGDGITFAAIVDPDLQDSDLKLLSQPILLDWRFVDSSVLPTYFGDWGKSGEGWFSGNLLNHFIKPHPLDSEILEGWRQYIKEALASDSYSIKNTPYFELTSGEIALDSVPSISERILGLQVMGVFDPVSNNSGLYVTTKDQVSLRELQAMSPLIHGAVQVKNKALIFSEQSSTISNKGLAIIQMQGGERYLLSRSNDSLDALLLKPLGQQVKSRTPTDFSWLAFEESPYLIVSWKFEDKEFTTFYELDHLGPQLRIVNHATLAEKFFSEKELKWRVTQVGEVKAFDALTPLVATSEEYAEQHRPTALHIDLLGSLRKKDQPQSGLRYFFPEPLSEKTVGNRFVYRLYETVPEVPIKSGIYVPHAAGTSQEDETDPLVRGFLVSRVEEGGGDILAETCFSFQDQEIKVMAIAMDAKNEKGKNATLQLLFSPTQSKNDYFVEGLSRKQPRSFEDYTLFGFLVPSSGEEKDSAGEEKEKNKGKTEKKKLSEEPVIFFHTLKTGGTIITSLRIGIQEKEGEKKLAVLSSLDRQVNSASLERHDITSRILFDHDNQAYWVHTPDRARDDPKFRVMRLKDGDELWLSTHENLKLRLGSEKPLAEEKAFREDPWRVSDVLRHGDEEGKKKRDYLRTSPEYQADIFLEFRQILEDLSDPTKTPRHVVLLVPPELHRYAQEYPFGLRYRERDRASHWVSGSPNHDLHTLPATSSPLLQTEILSHLKDMRDASSHKRQILITSLQNVHHDDRPSSSQSIEERFQLRQTAVQSVDVGMNNNPGDHDKSVSTEFDPHVLFLLTTEGKRISLQDFQLHAPKNISMLLIGTEAQWNQVLEQAKVENSFGLGQEFEIVTLPPPLLELRVKLARNNVLHHPAIRPLNYRIDLSGIVRSEEAGKFSPEQAEAKIMSYFVHRAEQLAQETKKPVFEGFMKAINSLAEQLSINESLLLRRILDKSAIEMALLHVFPMPLNLNLLPDNDPLKILSQDDADFLWLQEGYAGAIALKERIMGVILRQLATDQVRALKSSAILFGEKGTGKTSAILTLFQMLGLKMYKLGAADSENSNAQAFYLRMPDVITTKGTSHAYDEPARQNMITLEKAITAFDTFLSGNHGPRGFIFLDDMQLAPGEVRAYFLSRIRAMQDQPTYRTIKGVERPTRNITVFIALNPIEDQERIKKFARYAAFPTQAEILKAALSSNEQSWDDSWLSRFADIINFSVFSPGAKGPALLEHLRSSRQTAFSNNQRFILVSPEVISSIIDHFPESDAREFLSNVPSALTSLADKHTQNIHIISSRRTPVPVEPKNFEEGQPQGMGYSPFEWMGSRDFELQGGGKAKEIEEFISHHFEAVPVENNFVGQIEFLHYLATQFRLKTFNFILRTMSENRNLMKNLSLRQNIALPFAQAIHRHLETYTEPFIEDLAMDPREFGIEDEGRRREFQEVKLEAIDFQKKRLRGAQPFLSLGALPRQNIFDELNSGMVSGETRRHVMWNMVSRFQALFEKTLYKTIQIKGSDHFKNPKEWLRTSFEEPKLVEQFGEEFIREVFQHLKPLFQAQGNYQANMTQYDAIRFLVIAIDKAISQLNWAKVTKFLVEALHEASIDMSIGQSPSVITMLFSSPDSILTPMDSSFVFGLARSFPSFEDAVETEKTLNEQFHRNCSSMLAQLGEAL